VKQVTIFEHLERYIKTFIMVILACMFFISCIYLVKQTNLIYGTIKDDALMNTKIQLNVFVFSSIDEDGDSVKQYIKLPKYIFTFLIPFICFILGFYFTLKSYSCFLTAISGKEKPFLKFLENIDLKIEKFETIMLIFALSSMLIIYFIQIIMQNLSPELLGAIQGGSWMPQISTLMVGVVGFFGASLALRKRQHIKIDIASRILPMRLMKQFMVVLDTAGFAISLLFSLLSIQYINFLRRDGSFFTKFNIGEGAAGHFLSIPDWPLKIFIPAAFIILSFRFFKAMVEGLIKTK